MAKLHVITKDRQREYDLQDINTIGRHPENSIQILDPIISKNHCQILNENGTFILRDLGSMNGTFLNGVRVINTVVLSDRDEMSLGNTKLVFYRSLAQQAAPLPTKPLAEAAPQVTIMHGNLDSHIRTRLTGATDRDFLPEKDIRDEKQLRRDYEKLRIAQELGNAVGLEANLDVLLSKILDKTFELLPANRGVILIVNQETNELEARAIKQTNSKNNEEIVLSRAIIHEVIEKKSAVLSSDASSDQRFKDAVSIIMTNIRSTMCVPILYKDRILGIIHLDSQVITNAFTEKDLQILTGIANQAAVAIDNSEKAKKLENDARARKEFERLLPPQIVEQVMSGAVTLERGGQARDTTVMFTDIRGFTAMSDGADPQEIVVMLNEYFERMVEIIHNNNGTLDKFMGDGIMALFGAPIATVDHAFDAVKASIEMLQALERFNVEFLQARGKKPIGIGIGLTTGQVVTGYLGSSRSMEYTAIGDEVNMASRFCGEANAGQIIISPETNRRIQGRMHTQRLSIEVKGKQGSLEVYEVLGYTADALTRGSQWMENTNSPSGIIRPIP